MLCFPLDNEEYEANALGAWLGTRTRGVFAAENNLSVTPNGGMTVKVNPGLAWLKMSEFWGTVCLQQEALLLTVSTAESASSRIDAVCARLNKAMNQAEIIIKKGLPLTLPIIPPVVRNDDYDEIYLATIRVPAGAVSISAANITDQRLNNTYCGLMRDGVTGIPTQDLYNAWYNWFDSLKGSADSQLNSWLDGFIATNENEFITWFTNLQNMLDENQASNLYNMMEQHISQQVRGTDGVHGIRVSNGNLQFYNGSTWVTLKSGVQGVKCNGTDVSTDSNGFVNITPLLLGAQKSIAIGTAAPSGGSNGDIYIQI